MAEVKADIDAMAKQYGSHIHMIKTAFLQDADSLILKADRILEILRHMKDKFPGLERVTTCARATTLKRKGVEEFVQLSDILEELDKFLALKPEQKKVYSLIRRSSSMNYPVDMVLDH